jgi:ABC-2 type transport system ATP-binding protein
VTFSFLSQALIEPVRVFGGSLDLTERIRTGDVAIDLHRPADLQGWWLADDLGRAWFALLSRGTLPLLAGSLVFTLHWPPLTTWAAFAGALVLALLVSFGLRYLVSLAVFWLHDDRGIHGISLVTSMFFCGLIVPLVVFPGRLGTVAHLLPWAALVQLPADVYLGKRTDLLDVYAFQAGWAAALLLGPNGAGKSTTIKMLTGILTPTSGRVRVAGLDPSRQRTALARRIGVVFGQRTTLWWDLPLRDSLTLVRHLYRVDRETHRARLAELTELLDLGEFLDTPVRQLSLGQRMRGDLAAALVHDPELLVLDEPTIGLDVVSKAAVRAFLIRLNTERGTTILLTTYDLGDVERLCVVIDHGRLTYDGSLRRLRETVDADRVLIVDLSRVAPPIEVDGAHVVRTDGPRQWLAIPPSVNAAAVVAAVAGRYEVEDIALREPGIEDVITRLYRTSAPTGR